MLFRLDTCVESKADLEKICNTEILKTFKLASLSPQVEACSLRWYGHILRLSLSTPARIIPDFNPSENGWKHPRGRPRTRRADVISQRLLNHIINPNDTPILSPGQGYMEKTVGVVNQFPPR